MFTGLIQHLGRIDSVEPRPWGVRLVVDAAGWGHTPESGESIAVNGCCLTLAEPVGGVGGVGGAGGGARLAFDVVRETLAKTTLGRLGPGSSVNLERSVTPTDLMGGHVVQGHVEGVGTVDHVQTEDEHRVRLRPPPALMECIVPKGSIAVEGVSLTVAAVDPRQGTFEIALIPTTLERTTLGRTRPGDQCNIETDILARTVVHWLRNYGGGRQ